MASVYNEPYECDIGHFLGVFDVCIHGIQLDSFDRARFRLCGIKSLEKVIESVKKCELAYPEIDWAHVQ